MRWGGRAGGGAPQVTRGGKRKVGFIEDPQLRFQFCEDLRRTVDNTLRYRSTKEDQQKYKKQLDKLVADRRRIKEEETRANLELERKLCLKSPPWGKSGPGGMNWRQPNAMGLLFHHSMGWTNETVLKNLEKLRNMRKQSQDMELNNKSDPKRNSSVSVKNGNGAELVPIIMKKKAQVKVPLSTTDVTRGDSNNRKPVVERNYLKDLSDQVNVRHQQLKALHADEIEKVRRHFETWGGFWGRPGNGAPMANTHKMKLDHMWIYPQPVSTLTAVH